MTKSDVIVIGAGVMGSSTAWWLARQGVDVVLIEQYDAGHQRGSSHGSTRIFRLAYPDPRYVDMARRALQLWRDVESDACVDLLMTTGGIDYGDAASVQSIVDALDRAAVAYETVDPLEASRRWPGFQFGGVVVHQPDAGQLAAEAAVRVLRERAARFGARFLFEEPVRSLIPQDDDRVVVVTEAERFEARTAVVTAGAWVSCLLAGLIDLPPLTVTREQFFHFASRTADNAWPSFIYHGDTFIYGLRGLSGEGIKVAEHHTGAVTTADGRSFDVDEAGLERVVRHVGSMMPGLDPTPLAATTCLYTNTPDESFIVERHGPIVVGSACSGHAFKFAPLIGQQLAELAGGPNAAD